MLCSFILCMEGYQLTTMRNTGVGKKSINQIFGHGREPRLSEVISLMRVIEDQTMGATKAHSRRQFMISHSILGEELWGFGCTLNSRRGFVILRWEGYLIFLFRLLWHIQSRPWPKIITSFVLFWCSCPQLGCIVILLNQILRMVSTILVFLCQEDFPFLSCPVQLRPVDVSRSLT